MTTSPGTYYYGVCVAISSTSNYCSASIAVTITPNISPDLTISSFTANPTTINPGGIITLSATVRNSGTGSSNPTTLKYYRSTDSTLDNSDIEITTDAIPSLLANGNSSQSATITGHTSGTAYYRVCVTSVRGESVTNNNCSVEVEVAITASLLTNVANVTDGGNLETKRS